MKRFWRWVALYAAKKAGLPVERRCSVSQQERQNSIPVVHKLPDTAYAQMGPPQRRSAMERYNWTVEES